MALKPAMSASIASLKQQSLNSFFGRNNVKASTVTASATNANADARPRSSQSRHNTKQQSTMANDNSLEHVMDDDIRLSDLVGSSVTSSSSRRSASVRRNNSNGRKRKGLDNPWKAKKANSAHMARATEREASAVATMESIVRGQADGIYVPGCHEQSAAPLVTGEILDSLSEKEQASKDSLKHSVEKASMKTSCRDGLLFSTSKNIALHLGRRSLLGQKQRQAFAPPPPCYTDTSSWLQLHNPSGAGCRKVAWDYERDSLTKARLGSLLACAHHDGWIHVYEMDTIQARELRTRSGKAADKVIIEPCLSFRTLPALDMQWDPFNCDRLAIQTHQGLQIYDLEQVGAWLYERRDSVTTPWDINSVGNNKAPCLNFECKIKCSASATILFLPNQKHVLTAVDDCVHCFDLRSGNNSKKTVWSLLWRRVTAMTCIKGSDEADLVLLGSSTGNVCIVDIQNLQRQSFSIGCVPNILHEWSTCHGIDHPAEWMGISLMHVESLAVSKTRFVGRFTWATNGGWVMSEDLDIPAKALTNRCIVHYKTKAINYVNAENEKVQSKRRAWSTPSHGRCRSYEVGGLLALEHVADMTHVLPRTDQRVLAATDARIVQDNTKPRIMLMWTCRRECRRAVVPLRDNALGLAIHPQHEWIAVASNKHGAYLVHSRKRDS
ncbi:hypothetical protein MPSEU_000147700 [Mayamaea pseudoterrestris]|nr:hypothetical protein MPSEU_000147700 [Mayamaea pseudoterrestris]